MNLPSSVTEYELAPGVLAYRVEHALCSGAITPYGATVLSWKPVDEEEVIFLGEKVAEIPGGKIPGGIPICWPWFGAHPSEDSAPNHGLVRNQVWDLKEVQESPEGVTFAFSFKEGIWSAELQVRFGAELEMALFSLNTTEIPIVVSGAIHPFFQIADLEQVRVVGLEDAEYFDKVSERANLKHKAAMTFSGEVDRVYDSSSNIYLVDDLSGRTILIEKGGSPSTVVWNPGKERAAERSDLANGEYLKFCCVEAAIANDRAEIVMPGGSHELRMRISIDE